MTEIRLEVPEGRAHDDHLGVGERAIVDWLGQLPPDRLRAVIEELVSLAHLRVEVEIAQVEG